MIRVAGMSKAGSRTMPMDHGGLACFDMESGRIRHPSVVAEQNGLKLTTLLTKEPQANVVHVRLENLTTAELVVLQPYRGGLAPIWDSSGFVLEKRSSVVEVLWSAHEKGCIGPVMSMAACSLAPGDAWESESVLPQLVQSWTRARPPAERPKPELGPDNLEGLVVLTRIRVKVFAPRTSTVPDLILFGDFPRSAEPRVESPRSIVSSKGPAEIPEPNGLQLDAFVTEESDGRRLHVELTNLSAVEVAVFDPEDGPAPIWDDWGFVLEKRSSNDVWRRAVLKEGCVWQFPGSLLRLAPGEVWTSVSPLPDLQQSWVRDRPPRDPPTAELRPDNVLAAIAITDIRVKVLTPLSSSVPRRGPMGLFPTDPTSPPIPSVEVEVPLARPIYVLPPTDGPVLHDGGISLCGCMSPSASKWR